MCHRAPLVCKGHPVLPAGAQLQQALQGPTCHGHTPGALPKLLELSQELRRSSVGLCQAPAGCCCCRLLLLLLLLLQLLEPLVHCTGALTHLLLLLVVLRPLQRPLLVCWPGWWRRHLRPLGSSLLSCRCFGACGALQQLRHPLAQQVLHHLICQGAHLRLLRAVAPQLCTCHHLCCC
jgi:hypothetical protein